MNLSDTEYYIQCKAEGNEPFEKWLRAVAKVLETKYQMKIEDIGDTYYLDKIFENKQTPHFTAVTIAKEIMGLT